MSLLLRSFSAGSPCCRVIVGGSVLTRNNSKLPSLSEHFTNRNPRNLERMRIGYKPDGYHLESPGRRYWHKLKLSVSGRHVTAHLEHFENGQVLKVSTSEWAIKKHLYRSTDTSAYINLARVFADRCLRAGFTEMHCDITPPKADGKVALFLETLKEQGLVLQEPPQFKKAQPWDLERPEKPWQVSD